MFGQIADCVRFESHLKTAVSMPQVDRDTVPWDVYQLVRYAAASAAPSLAVSIIPVTKDRAFPERAPLAVEARQMVYSAISAGAGGLAYRFHIPWSKKPEWGKEGRDRMIDEVTKVNCEIRQMQDYLAMGFPRPIAQVSDPKIQVTCIDALPKGMVLILINHDVTRSPPELPPAVEANEHRDVTIELVIPEGFAVESISEINGSRRSTIDTMSREDRKLKINVSSIGATKVLLVKTEPLPYDKEEDAMK